MTRGGRLAAAAAVTAGATAAGTAAAALPGGPALGELAGLTGPALAGVLGLAGLLALALILAVCWAIADRTRAASLALVLRAARGRDPDLDPELDQDGEPPAGQLRPGDEG